MRILVGGCYGEVHSFLTARATFRNYVGQEIIDSYRGTGTCLGGFIDAAERTGAELIPGVYSTVGASPMPTRESYDEAKQAMLEQIAAAGKIDGILLDLHGALTADGMAVGIEGDYVQAIREVVGPDIPIVSTADPHGNVSEAWVAGVNAIFCYDSTPHIDEYDRGVEAMENMVKIVHGEIRPVMALRKPGMQPPTGLHLANYPGMKPEYPMAKVWQEGFAWEAQEGVINVNIFIGFSREDVDSLGSGVVVVTNNDLPLAERAAEAIARVMWDVRDSFWLDLKSPQQAVEMAMAAVEGPVVLHNPEDDPAGGAPADGNELLKTLLERGAQNAAVWLHDAEAVREAIAAGVANSVTLKVGGKLNWRFDGKHAEPLEITGHVKALTDGKFTITGPVHTGAEADMGRTAVIQANGVDVVVCEKRVAAIIDPGVFRSVGIEPTRKKIIVVKQTHHWRAAYEPIVKRIISVTCPNDYGVGSGPINRLTGEWSWPYKNMRRPLWPLDQDAQIWF
ncbi:MAG: M81 family metallopeptidase [Chloroflexi bacterium]|nr:M81 family metallopeptidase [Chloroflexota bacterium]